jgi:hypothetical protein
VPGEILGGRDTSGGVIKLPVSKEFLIIGTASNKLVDEFITRGWNIADCIAMLAHGMEEAYE